MKNNEIVLKMSKEDSSVGYLFLPKHPKEIIPGVVKNTIPIESLIEGYKGIPLNLDFNEDNELIGIEIVG